LGKLGDPRAYQPLVEALVSKHWSGLVSANYGAIEALGLLGDKAAAPVLEDFLAHHENYESGKKVFAALNNLGCKPQTVPAQVAEGIQNRETQRLLEIGEPAVNQLYDLAISTDDYRDREFAVELLGNIGGKEAINRIEDVVKRVEQGKLRIPYSTDNYRKILSRAQMRTNGRYCEQCKKLHYDWLDCKCNICGEYTHDKNFFYVRSDEGIYRWKCNLCGDTGED
jgi:hypothetical protein